MAYNPHKNAVIVHKDMTILKIHGQKSCIFSKGLV